MIKVAAESIAAEDLSFREHAFLNENDFLGLNPGEDAAAIMACRADGTYAVIEGAACPNSKRRGFAKLLADKNLSLRLMGVTVFLVAPDPLDSTKLVLVMNWDRRVGPCGHFCASAQGGVAGGQSFLDAAFHEVCDELFIAGVSEGRVTRVLPADFQMRATDSLDTITSADNPFRVEFEMVEWSGRMIFEGYHDYVEEGYLSAMYSWQFRGVPDMKTLFGFSLGTYNAAWQDALIPAQGSVTKLRVQSTLVTVPITTIVTKSIYDAPISGIFMHSQGFMPIGELDNRVDYHPTLIAWSECFGN